MSHPLCTVKVELDIHAQRIMSHLQSNNKDMEAAVEKGVQKALDEISNDEHFVEKITALTKAEIYKIAERCLSSWDIRQSIEKALRSKIEAQLETYSQKIADQITKQLK